MSTLYSFSAGAKPGAVNINTVWSAPNGGSTGLPSDLTQIVGVALGNKSFIAGYSPARGALDFFALGASGKITPKPVGSFALGTGWDIVQPFTIAKKPALLAYSAQSGAFQFWSVSAPGKLLSLGTYPPPNTPPTTGFTLVQPLAYRNVPYLLGYNTANGTVSTYQLGKDTASPLAVQELGTWTWAKGWARFGFFQFGGEWYFIKTNTVYKKVFLDHLWDDPSTYPSHPVCETFPLSQSLQAITTFSLGHFPYYFTYASNGAATVSQIWGDGTGSTLGGKVAAPKKASLVSSFANGATPLVLVYA